MSRQSNELEEKALSLRRTAEHRISAGSAPRTSGLPLDKDALSTLYGMVSDPERSHDALRLLQELQVHQVELDLQWAEIENNERDLSRQLARFKALFELAPAALVVATMEGWIVEANPAASQLLSNGHGELEGRALDEVLRLERPATWSEMLRELPAGQRSGRCEVYVGAESGAGASPRTANYSTEGNALLVTVAGS